MSPPLKKKSLLINFLISILPRWKIRFKNVPKLTGLLRVCHLPDSHLHVIFTYTSLPSGNSESSLGFHQLHNYPQSLFKERTGWKQGSLEMTASEPLPCCPGQNLREQTSQLKGRNYLYVNGDIAVPCCAFLRVGKIRSSFHVRLPGFPVPTLPPLATCALSPLRACFLPL